MATPAVLKNAIATNERYAANYTKAGKDPAKYVAKIAALKAELAALSAPKAAAAPAASNSDVTPLVLPDMSARATDLSVLAQQYFAIEAGFVLADPSIWPAESTDPTFRHRTLIQMVSNILSSGPSSFKDALLTVAQVLTVANWSALDPGLNLNPWLAEALRRGVEVANTAPDGYLPWKGMDNTVISKSAGALGTNAMSGWYGTGEGPKPA
jgi:hypothetical protein